MQSKCKARAGCFRGCGKYAMTATITVLLFSANALAQITGRGTLLGHVTDPTGAVVVGSTVMVTNVATGVKVVKTTDKAGAYEADELIPGPYTVTVDANGFKTLIRQGITLITGATVLVDVPLQIGSERESVTVVANASPLNNGSGMDGQVLESVIIAGTPVPADNPVLLMKLSRGVTSTTGLDLYENGSYNAGGNNASFGAFGINSANQFNTDGTPGGGHGVVPEPADAVNEMQTDTSGFDAQVGKTLGVNITMTTKNGTNDYHGTVREMYQDQRWQAFTHAGRMNYINNVTLNPVCETGQSAYSAALCAIAQEKFGRAGTHEHNFGATIGGPISLPYLFHGKLNGKDKLFFFFSYIRNPFTGVAPAQSLTVPTAQERYYNPTTKALNSVLDFSDEVSPTGVPYTNYTETCPGTTAAAGGNSPNQIYDPATVAAAPCRSGHYVRQPFANNQIPISRVMNPMAKFQDYEVPLPNNCGVNCTVGANGLGNYTYTRLQPQVFQSFAERIDYTPTENDRFFVSANKYTYVQETKGVSTDDIDDQFADQDNFSMTFGYVRTLGARTVIDTSVGYNRNASVTLFPNAYKFPASSFPGLPSYLGAQATAIGINQVPGITFSPPSGGSIYSGVTKTNSIPTYSKVASFRTGITRQQGDHSLKAGFEFQEQGRDGGGGGNVPGSFNYDYTYTRQFDDTALQTPQQLGPAYAAFLMGYQTTASSDQNALYNEVSPYFSGYVNDTWRIKPKLTLIAGIRYEYEFGPTEKDNRLITHWDPSQQLIIAPGAEAAYLTNLTAYKTAIGTLPAPPSAIAVQGGPVYAGQNGASAKWWRDARRLLPRVALAYQLKPSIVLRGGFGVFSDSYNVTTASPDQSGFSYTTSDAASTNGIGVGPSGPTWSSSNVSPQTGGPVPMSDPFFTQASGQRFISPVGNALGNMAKAGQSWTYYPANFSPAKEERWQVTYEEQLGAKGLLAIDYNGAWITHESTVEDGAGLDHGQAQVPAQYYTGGNTPSPNLAILSTQVLNPFYIGNFSGVQTSNPTVYNFALASNSFFTSKTTSLGALLHPYPQQAGLIVHGMDGQTRFNQLGVSYLRRMSQGVALNLIYQRTFQYDRTFYMNAFDPLPSWIPSNNSRPSRLTVTGVWDLPLGKQQKWANTGLLSAIFGGFEFSATDEQTQGPLVLFGNLAFAGTNPATIRKNGVNYSQWFDTSQFITASTGQLNTYNLRVFPPYIDGVRQQGYNDVNMGLQRSAPIFKERAHLLMRFQCMDVFNHTTAGAINTSPTSTQFGTAGADVSNFARWIEIAGKITF